ncbi:MAG: hypothetical protein A3A10_02490 [Candidatus Tagabacteria bacterium RIFCSPLOWO2_01_FULL_42_9]|uniref:PrgI family protein n=1 Tax=Candidatus Tagabacteria bacterium RIFCSPLOWO2_01_FULL_42_9 TaxID=1802296 RepID=A0A1G2LWP1_9BACT|nr:MAG: hypothetical protein A3A10_02490 [Candidatus Tagabacteria bacterium RIFCSPLOWO2_01_FULL_42_9]
MRFQVPQFTDIEDKIFGPFTLKQFIYLAGGAGGIILFYAFLPLPLTILLGIPLSLFSLALAFYKVHNQPFIKVVESSFQYLTSGRLYLWKKRPSFVPPKGTKKSEKKEKKETPIYMPTLTKNKLSDLAWSLDIKEKITRDE